MFEAAEIGHKLSKGEFKRIEPKLRADLLDAQFALSKDGSFPVIILISGVRGAGKGETVNLLNEWMDPRHIHTHAFDNPTDEERERPAMWRYWRALPPKGKIGMLFGSWYTAPIIDRVFHRTGKAEQVQAIEEINHFERMLADGGALVLKFWFHLSKKAQRKRLKKLERDPETSWKITERDWDFFKMFYGDWLGEFDPAELNRPIRWDIRGQVSRQTDAQIVAQAQALLALDVQMAQATGAPVYDTRKLLEFIGRKSGIENIETMEVEDAEDGAGLGDIQGMVPQEAGNLQYQPGGAEFG